MLVYFRNFGHGGQDVPAMTRRGSIYLLVGFVLRNLVIGYVIAVAVAISV
jgi:hypothetical protein